MLVKESSDLNLQVSCAVQLAHRNGVFKKFTLDSRRQIVPLHDDCGAQTPQNMLLFLGRKSCRRELFAARPLQRRPRYPILRGHWRCLGVCVCVCDQASPSLKFLPKLEIST